MKPRLLILIALAGGIAVWIAVRPASSSTQTVVKPREVFGTDNPNLEERQILLGARPLAGEEPPEEPELAITVEVDPTLAKNRLYYYISEAHGYYVESFKIEFYCNPTPEKPLPEDASPTFVQRVEDYVEAGKTTKGCLEVVTAELGRCGGRMGRSENWEAEIVWHGRARGKNPDPLPVVDRLVKCD